MTVSQLELRARLADRDPDMLRAVLEASDVSWSEEDDADELARRLVDALWWRTHSPAGKVVMADSLDKMVDRYGGRLELDLPAGDAWSRLQALTTATVPSGDDPLRLDSLDDDTRARLRRPIWGRLAGATGTGGVAGAGWLARRLLQGMAAPIWAVLAQLPYVGPAVIAVRASAGTILAVSGPLGVGLALLTLNSAFGPRYDRAMPLLVGAGLILRDLPAET